MVKNALLGVAAGRIFGLSLEECAAGLAAAPLTKARWQIKEIHGVQFIDDSYNANPDSMKAALRTMVELDTDGKRIAVLGEMRELGDGFSSHAHFWKFCHSKPDRTEARSTNSRRGRGSSPR